ncbi:YbgA family protein [Lentilactobacillus parakefiri]|uniref:DUF1722 domain-containing protein n=1 Tax=Lentilactobacillus parakefiri TaxID=152332 RepID=A0A269Y6U9_9LACO|nr:YbgA family protein [Lentilactobacillus parakefiri]PAK81297.1 hypothetical protein B8W98_07835 [Lentilactobacillus parakefiri]
MEEWQRVWAYNKYWIMARSQQLYNKVREMAKDNQWTPEKDLIFKRILEEAANTKPTRATLVTAYQHVWGYFKKNCTDDEKNTYLKLLVTLTPNNDQLGLFLKQLAIKYQITYLLESRIIKEI